MPSWLKASPTATSSLLTHALIAAACLLAGAACAARTWRPWHLSAPLGATAALPAAPRLFRSSSSSGSGAGAGGLPLILQHQGAPPGDPQGWKPLVPSAGLDVDPDVLWGRKYMLHGPELERGTSFGDPQRLRPQVARLMAGNHVRVTAVGASVTSGAGGSAWTGTRTAWPGYVRQFEDWLRAAFPRANATVHNAGMAGTFAGVFAQCFDTLIPEADLYVLEQTTFDVLEPETCFCRAHWVDTPVQLAIERLIRRMLRQPHRPAVLLLNTYSFRLPSRGWYQRSVENQVQVLAQFYGLPMASLRAAAWQRMLEGADGFDVSTSVKLYNGSTLPPAAVLRPDPSLGAHRAQVIGAGMGVGRLECVSGCRCPPADVDALWEQQASMLMTAELSATQHAACRMRVSVLERRGRSGSKFKVAGAMVLPAGTNEFNGKDRLEVVVPQMFEGRSFDGKVERMTNEDP